MNKLPSRSELVELVTTGIGENLIRDAVVYVFRELLSPNRNYSFGRKVITVEQPAVLLFADLEPGVNWSHQCLYILYDGNNSKTMPGEFPPPADNLLILTKPDHIDGWQLLNNENYNG